MVHFRLVVEWGLFATISEINWAVINTRIIIKRLSCDEKIFVFLVLIKRKTRMSLNKSKSGQFSWKSWCCYHSGVTEWCYNHSWWSQSQTSAYFVQHETIQQLMETKRSWKNNLLVNVKNGLTPLPFMKK